MRDLLIDLAVAVPVLAFGAWLVVQLLETAEASPMCR
jgi:hypothetical protein